jgi:hypothetical protein
MTPYGSSAYGTAPYGASASSAGRITVGIALLSRWSGPISVAIDLVSVADTVSLGITLRNGPGLQIVLASAMASASLGWPIRLTSRATGSIGAAIELRSVANAVATPILLVSRETGPISLGITLLGSVTAAAAADSVLWQPVVVVGGVDLSARLYGEITIEREEDASAIAELSYLALAGAVDPLLHVGQPVTISWAQIVGGVVSYARLRFTGLVADAAWDADLAGVRLSCTTALQDVCNAMTKADIERLIGGHWSPHVWSEEDSTGWTHAQQRLSTTTKALWHDEQRILRVTDLQAKATADLALGASDILSDSAQVSYAQRGDMVNRIRCALDFRYLRQRQRWVDVVWRPQDVCSYLQDSYQFCQRSMVEGAATSGGWQLDGAISYVPLWPNDYYWCGNRSAGSLMTGLAWNTAPAVAATLCIGASWRATKRWHQTVTETYTLLVEAPQSLAAIGEVEQDEEYGIESTTEPDTAWEQSSDLSPVSGGRSSPEGDWIADVYDDATAGRAAVEDAMACVVAAAQGEILRAHRGTTVSWDMPYQPGLSLQHTLSLTLPTLVCHGKVRALRDRLSLDSGEAITTVELAISRRNGSGLVATTPPAAVPQPADPAEPRVDRVVTLGLHIGGRTYSPPEDQTWGGLITNYTYDPTAVPNWSANPTNPSVNVYSYAFAFPPPEIADDFTATDVDAGTTTYTVDIPDDTLTLIAP